MSNYESINFNKLKPAKIILPTFLGLGIVVWLFIKNIDNIDFSILNFSIYTLIFLFFAFLMMVFRDFGYIIRLRLLSDKTLSWRKCFRIIMLWEFASAITPSAVGGTALATVFIWKEGLNIGKSTSIVIATSFLDELYFSIMFPFIFLFFTSSELFTVVNSNFFTNKLLYFVLTGYIIKLVWTILMGYSIFGNPKLIANIIERLFRLRILKRWHPAANKLANDFETSNIELKNKSLKFWIKSFLTTFLSWTSRYWVLNFILLSFLFSVNFTTSISVSEHFLIFARQLIMWIMMLVMPTPGGSGFIEMIFTTYMSNFVAVAEFIVIIALIWRLVTYYPYLIIGSIITPKWISKNFKKK